MRQIDLMVSAKKAEWENHMHAVQIQLDKKTKEIEFVKVQLEQKCQEVKLLHIKVLCIETLNCRMCTISQNWLGRLVSLQSNKRNSCYGSFLYFLRKKLTSCLSTYMYMTVEKSEKYLVFYFY